ncbi:hypothetical protein D3C80_429660 [compost metagenome]
MKYLLVMSASGALVSAHRLLVGGGPAVVCDYPEDAPYTPIQWAEMAPGRFTGGQRRQLDMRARLRAAVAASPLREQVAETVATLDQRKADGAKPERLHELVEQRRGTPCIADWMGYASLADAGEGA